MFQHHLFKKKYYPSSIELPLYLVKNQLAIFVYVYFQTILFH